MNPSKKASGTEKTQGAETAPNSTTTTVANGGGSSPSKIEDILKERFIKMSKRLINESKIDTTTWNSDILLTANDINGNPAFHIVISARNGDLVLWIKPPTLRNGMPLPLSADTITKIDKLINALVLLKSVLPDVLSELGISNVRTNKVSVSGDRIEI